MRKRFFIILGLLIFLLIPKNVFALSYSGIQTFYSDATGTNTNNSVVSTASWGAYNVIYNNVAFGGGSFSNIPNVIYSMFPSGLGCSNKNCILKGVVVAYTPMGVGNDNLLSQLDVQVEANGFYKSCSITNLSSEYNIYNYATFECANFNLNTGFNVVFSNFAILSNNISYFGVAPSNFEILSNLTADDIIVNSSANTQSIINNNTTNTQSIINNNTTNTQSIINNQNQSTQAIINNQNQNVQAIIDGSPYNEEYSLGVLDDIDDLIPKNGVIGTISTLPVTLLQAFNVGISSTCTPFSLGSLYGTDLSLPCINIPHIIGQPLWIAIDLICCGLMIFAMSKKFVKVFNDVTSLNGNLINELYGGGR